MNESQTRDLGEFFNLARNECCNYSATGPSKIKHYCCIEPRQSDKQCLLSRDLGCKWFVEAVLPRDKDLHAEWQRVWLLRSDPSPTQETFRTCECGRRFKLKSNRQRMCPECSKANRKKLTRNGMRRQRVKRVVV